MPRQRYVWRKGNHCSVYYVEQAWSPPIRGNAPPHVRRRMSPYPRRQRVHQRAALRARLQEAVRDARTPVRSTADRP